MLIVKNMNLKIELNTEKRWSEDFLRTNYGLLVLVHAIDYATRFSEMTFDCWLKFSMKFQLLKGLSDGIGNQNRLMSLIDGPAGYHKVANRIHANKQE